KRPGEGPIGVVRGDQNVPVPVGVGSEVIDGKPTVVGCEVVRGSQVVAIGQELQDDGKADGDNQVWLPIQPPPAELRYIKAEAVVKAGAPEQANPPAPAGA